MMFRCGFVSPNESVRRREEGTVSLAILMIHVAAWFRTCNQLCWPHCLCTVCLCRENFVNFVTCAVCSTLSIYQASYLSTEINMYCQVFAWSRRKPLEHLIRQKLIWYARQNCTYWRIDALRSPREFAESIYHLDRCNWSLHRQGWQCIQCYTWSCTWLQCSPPYTRDYHESVAESHTHQLQSPAAKTLSQLTWVGLNVVVTWNGRVVTGNSAQHSSFVKDATLTISVPRPRRS